MKHCSVCLGFGSLIATVSASERYCSRRVRRRVVALDYMSGKDCKLSLAPSKGQLDFSGLEELAGSCRRAQCR